MVLPSVCHDDARQRQLRQRLRHPLLAGDVQMAGGLVDEDFWSTIPAIPGALEACELLTGLGYELVCITGLDERFSRARAQNLQSLGFPIARVVTTDNIAATRSPKAMSSTP